MISVGITVLTILVILIGLAFTFTNGLHDASSVVATIICCGAASPKQAVLLASCFELIGAVTGGSAVADTISEVIDLKPDASMLGVLFAVLAGAIAWNLITWRLGLPSSSTHALVGGIIGAVWVYAGPGHILWGWHELVGQSHIITGIVKILAGLIISPLIGFFAAFVLEKIAKLIFRNAKFKLNIWLKRVQWVIAAALAYNHGANDTQKTVGIIMLALTAGGGAAMVSAPLWVRLCGGFVMFIGVLFGGWRIVNTIGKGIFTIRPLHSVVSQLSSFGSIMAANLTGAPASTTHVVVGSVMGVGAADEYKMVNWGAVKGIFIAWGITIPLSAVVSALIFTLYRLLFQLM